MTQVDPTKTPPHTPPPQRLDAASHDPKPTYLSVNVYGKNQRFPLEVWRACNGNTYAVVTDVAANVSLANGQEKIVAAIKADWGESTSVIEYWPSCFMGMRYYRSVTESSGGGGLPVDFEELDKCGLYLKPPRP